MWLHVPPKTARTLRFNTVFKQSRSETWFIAFRKLRRQSKSYFWALCGLRHIRTELQRVQLSQPKPSANQSRISSNGGRDQRSAQQASSRGRGWVGGVQFPYPYPRSLHLPPRDRWRAKSWRTLAVTTKEALSRRSTAIMYHPDVGGRRKVLRAENKTRT